MSWHARTQSLQMCALMLREPPCTSALPSTIGPASTVGRPQKSHDVGEGPFDSPPSLRAANAPPPTFEIQRSRDAPRSQGDRPRLATLRFSTFHHSTLPLRIWRGAPPSRAPIVQLPRRSPDATRSESVYDGGRSTILHALRPLRHARSKSPPDGRVADAPPTIRVRGGTRAGTALSVRLAVGRRLGERHERQPSTPSSRGKLGPVVARNGHLYTGNQRFRIVGVNLCFGANFPSHADAEKVAARMAKFGINCVRFHHMDMQPPPGGLLQADRITLDPGQLDKLDFLIARLKDHGIYADLNLHVSRTFPGLPTWDGMPSFHKGVDNFDPRMIALQKDYARALLTHRNPYTKTRYVDEPAVAIVEINNENALLHEWWSGELDGMIEPYRGELARQWNAWLKAKYADTSALKAAWRADRGTPRPGSLEKR